jgi:hypothetical protein
MAAEESEPSWLNPDSPDYDRLRALDHHSKLFARIWTESGLYPCPRLSASLRGSLEKLLADPYWRANYPAAIRQIAKMRFYAEEGARNAPRIRPPEFLRNNDRLIEAMSEIAEANQSQAATTSVARPATAEDVRAANALSYPTKQIVRRAPPSEGNTHA